MTKQKYENYWSLTLAFSNIHDTKFNSTLKVIVDFIDKNKSTYSKELYGKLQEEVSCVNGLIGTSLRKSINQFVKLGFIKFNLAGYDNSVKDFLEAKTKKKRNSLFSKIVYSNSSFNSSVTEYSEQKEINFLIKTLEEVGKLEKKDVVGLMTVDIEKNKKGFLTMEEVIEVRKNAEDDNFIDRKYNQVTYLWNILKKLDDLIIHEENLYFEEDALVIFPEGFLKKDNQRDNYLHRIYKNQLKEEVNEKAGSIQCMLEKLQYPSLVASHIKPFIKSNTDTEAYDPENGLLLSRNMDILFDQGYITFENNGEIICSEELKDDVKKSLSNYILDNIYINDKRLSYMKYHRDIVFKK